LDFTDSPCAILRLIGALKAARKWAFDFLSLPDAIDYQ